MKAGDRAAMFYPSAHRDETRLADPGGFDIGRARTRTWLSAVAEPFLRAVESDERHPLDARHVQALLRQRKLLTYLPISRARPRLAPEGCPEPKSGVNS